MTIILRHVDAVRPLDLPRHARADGAVVVAETGAAMPFAATRMFTVTAPLGAERGQHAHKLCSQFMWCVHGAVDVICDDGASKRTFALNRDNHALLVPPTIWGTILYREANSVLAVLCDRLYEAEDYIRDYSEFIAMRKGS